MHVDIGAYEATLPDTPQTSPILSVTKTGDTNDGFCGILDCSLREALAAAEAGDTIAFWVTGTIVLTGGHLLIDKDLTTEGPVSGELAISGNNANRVFVITSGNNVTISDVTIQDGDVTSGGGGILNEGTLTLTNSTVSGNRADDGGGIYNNLGTLTLTNSTVSGNRADDGGRYPQKVCKQSGGVPSV